MDQKLKMQLAADADADAEFAKQQKIEWARRAERVATEFERGQARQASNEAAESEQYWRDVAAEYRQEDDE